jgi:hypothetical protein
MKQKMLRQQLRNNYVAFFSEPRQLTRGECVAISMISLFNRMHSSLFCYVAAETKGDKKYIKEVSID